MSTKWRTITLPEATIEKIKKNMKGFTSISEFVRTSIRFYFAFQMKQNCKEKIRVRLSDDS